MPGWRSEVCDCCVALCCLRCVWSMWCVSTGFAPGRAWCLLSALCVVHAVRVYGFRTRPGVVPAVCTVCGPCGACLQVSHRARHGACCLRCVWSMRCVSTGFAPGRAWCLLSALSVVHAVHVYRFRTGPGMVPAVCAVCGPCGACLQVSHQAGHGACCLRCVWSMRCVSTGFALGRAWCLLSALCVVHAVRVYRFRTGPGVVPAVCAVCGPCGACLQVSHRAGHGACCLRCVWSMWCVSTGFAPGRAWCLLSGLCVVHAVRVYRFCTGPGVVPAVWAVCGPCSACLQVLHRAGRGACCLRCVWSMRCVSTGFAPGRAWCLLSALCVVHAVRVYRFRTGPGVVPQKVPQDLSHLVLVLNGRTSQKVDSAKSWLDLLPQFRRLQRVVLVLLGNEKCENQWLTPYLSEHGGFVGAVFVVYDSTEVDDVTFFQWPLGVATYVVCLFQFQHHKMWHIRMFIKY